MTNSTYFFLYGDIKQFLLLLSKNLAGLSAFSMELGKKSKGS
jgi:hypothetical protein